MATPADFALLPPVGNDIADVPFPQLIAQSGVILTPQQVEQLGAYRDALFEQNKTTNLTAVRDIPGIERRLLLESLRLVPPLLGVLPIDRSGRQSLIDVGTGGGLPGMVLAIACPGIHVYLLDATGKKVAFLDRVIASLGLTNASTIHGRAEEIGQQPRYRNAFDVVTARAVTSLPALLELGLPLLRTRGTMLLPKGADITEELDAGYRAAAILKADIDAIEFLPDVGSTIDTRLVIVRKTEATPRAYPRRSGIPSKNPLGIATGKPPGAGAGHNDRGSP